MHRVDAGTYIGELGEQTTLATEVDGGGQVRVTLDNQDTGATRQFTLGANPGDRRTLRIALAGPLGATCVVTIAVVDGTTDGDFLICQPHDPAPVHTYTFDAAAKVAIAKFAIAVGAASTPAPEAAATRTSEKGAKRQKGKPAGKRGGA
jgi:hypothetical protein